MNIYLQNETDFAHNGLGFLTDVLSANVTDNLNGDYSLFFEYKINGNLSEYLQNENIIKCKVADGTKQLFIIKNVVKTFKLIQVNCKHIFYSLLDNFVEDVAPTNLSAQPFLQWILDRTNYKHNFKAYSDISTVKSARYVRRNPVDCILGDTDNSMVNLFGGELKRDNFDIHFTKMVGVDNGVKLIVGKNITGINITIDTNSVYTKIMPQGFDGLLLPEKYVNSPLINTYTNPKIHKVEFSDIKYEPDNENSYNNLDDAYDALRDATNKLYENGADKPIINVKIDWIELSKTNEYKNYSNLEKVDLGDTITIDLLGITYKTRVIKTVYNPLTNKIESFELGTPKADIGTFTNNFQKKLEQINPTSILEQAKDNATQLLTKAMGGYVYKTQNELFIMDTDNPDTATKVWRWNMNGLGYSSNGIDGPYETAITSDGKIVADFITTGKLNTNVIEGYDSLIEKVSKVIDLTKDISQTGYLFLDDAMMGPIQYLSITGKFELLYPKDGLYPEDELYPLEPYLVIRNSLEENAEIKKILLPIKEINEGEKLEIDNQGNCTLTTEIGGLEILGKINFQLFEGDNYIYLESNYPELVKYNAKYIVKNQYTDLFVTELQMNSVIKQTTNEINLEVSKKVGEDEVIAAINLSSEEAEINADKVSLKGKELQLTSDNISINSKYLTIDKYGNINASSGNFSGTINTKEDARVGKNIYIGDNDEDDKYIKLSDYSHIRRITGWGPYGEAVEIKSKDIQLVTEGTSGISVNHDNSFIQSQNIYLNGDSNVYSSKQIAISSDKRLKENIKEIEVSWINDLNIKEFEYKNDLGRKQIGLIAQDYVDEEYSKYFLNKVKFPNDDEEYYVISYGNITNALIKYCQNLNNKIVKLEKRIEELEGDKNGL